MEKENEIYVDDIQDGDVIRNYGIDLVFKGKQVHLSVQTCYHTNPDFFEVENVEILEDSDKLTEQEKKEVVEWIEDNTDSWLEN